MKTRKNKIPSADQLSQMASKGKDISAFFTNKGKIMAPIQKVNVDFSGAMLHELDSLADHLNVSRQAVIKLFVRHGLDNHYLARKKIKKSA